MRFARLPFQLGLSAVFALIGGLSTAFAEGAPAKDTALVKELSEFVVVLNHPVYVYHWFNAANRNPVWKTALADNAPAGFDHVFYGAQRYYQAFCTNKPELDPPDCTKEEVGKISGRGNLVGPGLYAAVDPVATSSYAEGEDGWVLNQIHLPKGFRVAQLTRSLPDRPISKEALTELKDMGCSPSSLNRRGVLAGLVGLGNYGRGAHETNPDVSRCYLNVRRLLKDRLKIEAIYYEYDGTSFDQCATSPISNGSAKDLTRGNSIRQGAFVIANTARLRPIDVKVFNSQTRTSTKDRIRILSLFYQADKTPAKSPVPANAEAAVLAYYAYNPIPNYPNHKIVSSLGQGQYYICEVGDGNCVITSIALPDNLPGVSSYVVRMSTANLTQTLKNARFTKLLWEDLEGVEKDPTVSNWIERNLLACQDIAPMGPTPNLRRSHFTPISAKGLTPDN